MYVAETPQNTTFPCAQHRDCTLSSTKERYNVYIVDIKGQDWHVELPGGITARIDRNDFSFVEDGKAKLFDYAYITIHGTPGENGILQGYFDLIDLPYSTSGVLVEAMTFDKFVLNQYLRGYGVSVADSLLIRQGYEQLVSDDEIEQRLGMPCFVKPAADGSSFGVSKVKNKDQLAPAIRKAMLESLRDYGGAVPRGYRDFYRYLQDARKICRLSRYGGGDPKRVLRL